MSEARPVQTGEARKAISPGFDLTDDLQLRLSRLDLLETVQHVQENGFGYIYDATSLRARCFPNIP